MPSETNKPNYFSYKHSRGIYKYNTHNKCSRCPNNYNKWYSSWLTSSRLRLTFDSAQRWWTVSKYKIIVIRCRRCTYNFRRRFSRIFSSRHSFKLKLTIKLASNNLKFNRLRWRQMIPRRLNSRLKKLRQWHRLLQKNLQRQRSLPPWRHSSNSNSLVYGSNCNRWHPSSYNKLCNSILLNRCKPSRHRWPIKT